MATDSELVCSNWWELIEDDGLDDILQLAETIRANPVYDDVDTDHLLSQNNSRSCMLAVVVSVNSYQ